MSALPGRNLDSPPGLRYGAFQVTMTTARHNRVALGTLALLLGLISAGCDKVSETLGVAADAGAADPLEGFFEFVDDQGVVNFVDCIEKVPEKFRDRARQPKGGAYTILPATPIDEVARKQGVDPGRYAEARSQKRHSQVIIYTTSWCPACKHAKAYLDQRKVAFIERDVEKSRDHLTEMLQKSGGAAGVPVIDVRGTILRGFNPRAIEQALSR